MNGYEFRSPGGVCAALGASSRIGELAFALGCRHIMLVTDPGVTRLGLTSPALASLQRSGVAVSVFSEVEADPPDHLIHAVVAQAKRAGVDGVLGLGGGSSLDVAKLVALLTPGEVALADVYGVNVANGARLPLILAPTTAGTGSEVTPISIVTTGEGEKKGVVSPLLLPDWAVLDAELTVGLPGPITAATGIDAMVHAIEAYTSKRLKNPISDCLAMKALDLLGRNLPEVVSNGRNLEARQDMLTGAMLAGMAFANAPVAAVHALAYPVGARFHVAHGLSNSLMLPAVLRFNLASAQALYADVASALIAGVTGNEASRAQALVDYFTALPMQMKLPARLSQVGIQAADLPALASDAMLQTRLLINNPRPLTEDDALAIYQESL